MLKPKPWWLRWTATYSWVTLAPFIYHPKGIDTSLYGAVIAHETMHLFRQNQIGKWQWLWCYFVHRDFRLDEEVMGMVQELRLYPEPRRTVELNSYAVDLASSRYLWAAHSSQEACDALRRAL